MDLEKSGSSNVQMPERATFTHKYKDSGNLQLSNRSGRRCFCVPEINVLQFVRINPRTNAKHLEKRLPEAGKRVSLTTVKQVLYMG